ncbi:MAG: hypothetical protein FJ125_07095, partial [Deltaproteobacteria bacterium]|nr:hypothetical protein [Deltaproteobacteria bacterium]
MAMVHDGDRATAAEELTQRLQGVRRDPRSEPLLRLALDLCRAGCYVEAEEVSRLELREAGETAAGSVALATALLGQGRVRDAAAEAVNVLRREPSFVPAHRIL